MANFKLLKNLDLDELIQLLEVFQQKYGDFKYDTAKHLLEFSKKEFVNVRLPLCIQFSDQQLNLANFLVILIHSGEAALAFSEEDQITEHKIIKAYMVRQKQGKSQIKHLKTKGKSKAGSRVRLAGTDHFFEEINEKISEWKAFHKIDKIAISCNKTLQPYFFNRPDAALQKEDNRLIKIPKHIQESNFENLTAIHNYLVSTELSFEETEKNNVQDLIRKITNE